MDKDTTRDIGYLIKRIGDRIRTNADCRLKHCGVTFSQILVMAHINAFGGCATQKQIETAMGVSHPTIVGLVGRLEAAGFVRCKADENDRRHKQICLEPKAYALEQQIRLDRQRNEEIMMAGMTEEESEMLYRLLEKVYANLGKESEQQEAHR